MTHEDAIRAHSRQDAPNEACGLIVHDDEGDIVALQTRNTTGLDPTSHFRIDPAEYLEALQRRRLIGFYHTHPAQDAEPSKADLKTVKHTGLPMWIYGGATDELRCVLPERRAPLLGRKFVPLFQDCVNLVWDAALLAGVELPHLARDGRKLNLGSTTGWREWFPQFGARFVTDPEPGDMLILDLHCATRPNHLGIYLGDGHLLHQTSDALSHRIMWGGYWKAATVRVIRIPALHARGKEIADGTLDFPPLEYPC